MGSQGFLHKQWEGLPWGEVAPSLGETLLPSSDAGASETLFPDTMAKCHLPIVLQFPSGFWALRFRVICVYGHACDLRVWIGTCVEIRG